MSFQAGDPILVWEPATGKRWLMRADGGHARKIGGLGVVDPNRFIGTHPGTKHTLVGKDVVLLVPTPADLQATIRRKAQIIGVKDASRIAWELGLGPGMRVLESGVGSASATIVMAQAVGETGKIVVQELREDFGEWAQDNLERARLNERVEMHFGDLTQGLADGVTGPFDAVLLDQPEPWSAIPLLPDHLHTGARIACYIPQVSQMERTYKALAAAGFADLRAIELMERAWEVKEFGSRPGFGSLGFTAFLVFGRYLGDPPAGET